VTAAQAYPLSSMRQPCHRLHQQATTIFQKVSTAFQVETMRNPIGDRPFA
jgi:hypothetical protein